MRCHSVPAGWLAGWPAGRLSCWSPQADTFTPRAAELLNSLPEPSAEEETTGIGEAAPKYTSVISSPNADPEEALLEAKETSKYLLAKAFFDCREFDRCAAVFLPDSYVSGFLNSGGQGPQQQPRQAEGQKQG